VDPGWDDGGDDVEPLARRRNPLVMVIAVVVAFALAAGGVIVAVGRNGEDDLGREVTDGGETGTGNVAPTTQAPPSPPSAAELEAVVAEISDFVAAARELEFVTPVEVTLLDDEDFTARIQEDAVEDLEEMAETESVLRAFGLLDDDDHLADALTSFLGAGVVGFYDPESGELVVRGAAITPYVRLTLAHELTHALDDQHFELHRPALDEADDEAGFAFGGLVEGNAVRVEDEYRETMSDEERRQARDEELALGAGFDFEDIPRVLPQIIGFPYIYGPIFVRALLDDGDEDRIDAAYRDPPVTSEQVLDPTGWLRGEADPVTVPPPEAGGEVFDEGVLGLWGVVLLLEEHLGQQEAIKAASGWGGDWYVAWREGDRACVRTTFVMDTNDDLRDLASALDEWAAAEDDAEVDRGDASVTITSCA